MIKTKPFVCRALNKPYRSLLLTSVLLASPTFALAVCPGGTSPSATNLIANGNFSTLNGGSAAANTLIAGSFTSSVPYTGDNVYPPDTEISIQSGTVNYAGGIVSQTPFPGDPANSVSAENNYIYANGNDTGAAYTVWEQTITGLSPSTTYQFALYATNMIEPGNALNPSDEPEVQLYLDGAALGAGFVLDNEPAGGDQWTRIERTYTTGAAQTSATLRVDDSTTGTFGDDWGFTALLNQECVAALAEIDVQKSISNVSATGNANEYQADFSFDILNSGATVLNNVNLSDNFLARNSKISSVSSVTTQSVSHSNAGVTAVTSDFVPGANFMRNTTPVSFTGTSGVNNLAIGETLSVVVRTVFTVDPNDTSTQTTNSATGSATDPASPGTPITDISDGDANDSADDNATGGALDDNPSPIRIAQIGTAKSVVGSPTDNGDGTYDVTLDLAVQNTGTIPLFDLSLVDDIETELGANTYLGLSSTAATNLQLITSPTGTNSNVSLNTAFDGNDSSSGNSELLVTAGSRLDVGDDFVIRLVITIDPNSADASTPLDNQSTARGDSVADGVAGNDPLGDTDQSDNGTDATSNNGAGGSDDPTPISIDQPVIGVAKSATPPVLSGTDLYTTTFTFVIENLGTVDLTNVQIVENLNTTFPAPASFTINGATTVQSVSAGSTMVTNVGFNGNTNTNVLNAGSSSLEVGDTATITIPVEFNTGGGAGNYTNQVTASAESAAGVPTSDLSDSGSEPDADGNGAPGDANENDPTPLSVNAVASLSGNVWLDTNGDDTNNGETNLANWTITVTDSNGTVYTTTTDANGNYSFPNLPADSYDVVITNPQGTTMSSTTVTLAGGDSVEVNFPVDPSGVVYDSTTRAPISGVQLQMVDSAGNPLPAACLAGGQQPQTTGANGEYRFDVNVGADPACPVGRTSYRIEVIDFAGYQASTAIPAQTSSLDGSACPDAIVATTECEVQAQGDAPTGSSATPYYLTFDIAAGDNDIINNHIPLDPPSALPAVLSIEKYAAKSEVSAGDVVQYTIKVTNGLTTDQTNTTITDDVPTGFSYVAGTAVGIQTGADGLLDTADDTAVALTPVIATDGDLSFAGLNVRAGEVIAVRYFMTASVGGAKGSYTNTAQVLDATGNALTDTAQATVFIVQDPLLEETTIIGKVFHDRDADGYQDPATASDITIISEAFGVDGKNVGTLSARVRETDPIDEHQIEVRMPYKNNADNSFKIRTDEGTVLNFDNDGEFVDATHEGAMSAGLTGQDLQVEVKREDGEPVVRDGQIIAPAAADNAEFVITITNHGIEEEGIPGVRIATVEGLRIETDSVGRYHIAGVESGRWERGRNFIAKVDPQTLPAETAFTTENPRVIRLTSALMNRINFGVKLPEIDAQEDIAVDVPASAPTLVSETETVTLDNVIEAVRFESGRSQIPQTYIDQLKGVVDTLADKNNVRYRFIGHTDSDRLGASSTAKYGDNQGLSEARAQQVADILTGEVGIDSDAVIIAGRADQEPLADNDSPEGKAQNRRVEIEVLYDEVTLREETSTAAAPTTATKRRIVLPHGGTLWATEDPSQVDPMLSATAKQPMIIASDGTLKQRVSFILDSNYPALIQRWELSIYKQDDVDLIKPQAILVGREVRADQPVDWDGYFQPGGAPKAGENLVYVLRVFDQDDHFDETHPQVLKVVDEADAEQWLQESDADKKLADAQTALNQIAKQNIPMTGSRVRLHGADIDQAHSLTVNGQDIPIGSNNRFVVERQLPAGKHIFDVNVKDEKGKEWQRYVKVDVEDKYLFIVGLANLTVGEQDVSGNVELLSNDDHYDGDLYTDGRLAMYLKGKIKGKYLITAQIDTTEDELDNLGDNIKRRDPRALLRRLDPDEYYPVYGDDSTTTSDVDTQGAFYVRLDWDKSQLLWGNFNTPTTGTELAQYNRSLYGAQAVYRTNKITTFGDDRASVYAFGSEANTVQAHNEFAATGGSLYYLRNTDIVRGSEKATIETRDRDTGRVLNSLVIREGVDYQIDYLQGRMILNRPLSQVSRSDDGSLISNQPLGSDDVVLLVDYEYVPTGFDDEDVALGGRANGWINDHLGLGVTYVTEERDNGEDYSLGGVDVTIKASKGSYIKAEIAETEATQAYAGWISGNGGLSFAQNQDRTDVDREGRAYSLETSLNLADLGEGLMSGVVRAWYKNREAGFSTSKVDTTVDTKEIGLVGNVDVTDRIELGVRYTSLEQAVDLQRTFNLQGKVAVNEKLNAIAEVRLESTNAASNDLGFTDSGNATLGAIGAEYELSSKTDLYGSVQAVLSADDSYEDNNSITVGAKTQINSKLGVKGEVKTGDRGDALTLGANYQVSNDFRVELEAGFGEGATSAASTHFITKDGTELYGSYAVDTDRTDNEKRVSTFGQRKQFGNATTLYSEQQFSSSDEESGVTNVFGIDKQLSETLSLSGSIQHSELDSTSGDIKRDAITAGSHYKNGQWNTSNKLEYRVDKGAENTKQWLNTNAVDWKQSQNLRYILRMNMAITENDDSNITDAVFTEFDLGFAYRPALNDRWNILGKYSYLYDKTAQLSTGTLNGQVASGTDQKAHILSMEALYQLNQQWELGGKLATRMGETRVQRGAGDWIDSGATFLALRGRYHLVDNWDALAEYRWLAAEGNDDVRSGALLGVYRHLGDHFKIGAGYNFTTFDGDLKDLSYDDKGWFIDIVGKY